jgi:hypothetical protein
MLLPPKPLLPKTTISHMILLKEDHMGKKLPQEEVQNLLAQYNCTLISEYRSNGCSLKYICSCGDETKTTLGNIKRQIKEFGRVSCRKCSVALAMFLRKPRRKS